MYKRFIKSITGKLQAIDKSFLTFLKMNACFCGCQTIINLFINTFLLKSSGSFTRIMIYNIILGAAQPVFMVGTVFFLRRTSPIVSQRISFLLYGIAFIFMAVLGEGAAHYYWEIAVILAAASGFYYVTWCLQIASYTKDSNLDISAGLMNTFGSIIGLTFPIISGFVLSLFTNFTGYRILFIFVLLLAVLALKFSAEQLPLSQFDNDNRVHLRETAHSMLSDKLGRNVMCIALFSGLREGTFGFITTILIYQFVRNEAIIGLNSTLCSIIGIISASLYGFIATPKNRGRCVYISVIFTSFLITLLYFNLSTITLIAYCLLSSLVGVFIATPQINVYLAVLKNLKSIMGKGPEVHTVREFFYGTGRSAGILLLMAMPKNAAGYVTAMLILTLLQLVSAYIVARTQKQLDSEQQTI